MKVFIGWSKKPTEQVANALHDLLVKLFDPDLTAQTVFVSSLDVRAGEKWPEKIETAMREADFAILCVTKRNRENAWLLFESGFLEGCKCRRICPYLCDATAEEVPSPLATRQAKAFDPKDSTPTLQLFLEINEGLGERRRREEVITENLKNQWSQFAETLASLFAKKDDSRDPKDPTKQVIEGIGQTLKSATGLAKATQDDVIDNVMNALHAWIRGL